VKKIDFAALPPRKQYDIAGALRGPDSPVVSDALKWPITCRIRYYIAFCRVGFVAIRVDAFSELRWITYQDRICHSTGYLHDSSLTHWAGHSIAALEHIRKICFPPHGEDQTRLDKLRISEIDAMRDLLALVYGINVDMTLGLSDVDTGALLPVFERVREAARAVAEEVKRQLKGAEQ